MPIGLCTPILLSKIYREKNVLVVGCGFGDDALYLAKLGANVCAFDLSPDSLSIARALAEREGLMVKRSPILLRMKESSSNWIFRK